MIIYAFKNRVNNKIYVGQTIQGFRVRTMQHMRANSTYFEKALNKYGLELFDYKILDRAESVYELNEKEKYWIKKLDSMKPNGYNLCEGGGVTTGYQHRDESRRKMSLTKKKIGSMRGEKNHYYGKHHTPEIREKMAEAWKNPERLARLKEQNEKLDRTYQQRKVLNIETGEVFNSIKEAASKYNLKETHISRVCRGGRKTTGGFHWEYVDKTNDMTIPSQADNSQKV